MKPSTEELDVSADDIRKMLDDPAHADSFKLARRFGSAVRAHFKGRQHDSEMVISAAMAAISGAIREAHPEELDDRLDQVVRNVAMILRFDPGQHPL